MRKQEEMRSLWPKIDSKVVDTPIRILKEQTDLFNAQMNGLLRCALKRRKKSDSVFDTSYDYIAGLVITTPALPDFSMSLVEVKYLVAEAYPCVVINSISEKNEATGQKAENAKDFRNILKSILNSLQIKNALQNMLAQDI